MLDCQRRQMRVWDEVAEHTGERQQLAHDFRMAPRRLRNPHGLAGEPVTHLAPCIGDGYSLPDNARIGHQPQEGKHARPRQTDVRGSIEPVIEPVPRSVMLTEGAYMCINQYVGVDQDHLNVSPSAIASASLILSSGMSASPTSTARVRNGSRRFGRVVISLMPRRSASLISSLRLPSRALRRRSRLAATSSSMVRVVLMHHDINGLMS